MSKMFRSIIICALNICYRASTDLIHRKPDTICASIEVKRVSIPTKLTESVSANISTSEYETVATDAVKSTNTTRTIHGIAAYESALYEQVH